jgi:hypothetical protein
MLATPSSVMLLLLRPSSVNVLFFCSLGHDCESLSLSLSLSLHTHTLYTHTYTHTESTAKARGGEEEEETRRREGSPWVYRSSKEWQGEAREGDKRGGIAAVPRDSEKVLCTRGR